MDFVKQLDYNREIIQGLAPIDIVRLFQYVCEHENNVKSNPGKFDISYKGINKIKNKYDIHFGTCAQRNISKAKKHKFYLLFEQKKNSKASKDDKAHHLMRHIRNSIAHGYIKKKSIKKNKANIEIFEITDKNPYRNTMRGEISVPALFQLISELIKSRKD